MIRSQLPRPLHTLTRQHHRLLAKPSVDVIKCLHRGALLGLGSRSIRWLKHEVEAYIQGLISVDYFA